MSNVIAFNPADYLTVDHDEVKTTSLKVSEAFSKQHKDVLRKIDSLDCSEEFSGRNFALAEYLDEQGKKRPSYQMTKDGFIFLVMGFTGKKAAQVKEAYINAFNMMAEKLKATFQPEPLKITYATKDQRAPLVSAVRRFVAACQSKGRPMTYQDAHSIVNLKMGVDNIEELTLDQIPKSMTVVGELLERVILEGEYIAKSDPEPQMQEVTISHKQQIEISKAVKYACAGWLYNTQGCTGAVDNLLRHKFNIHSVNDIPQSEFESAMAIIETVQKRNQIALGLFADLRDEFFKEIIQEGAHWTGDLKKKYKAKFNKELPHRPNWQQIAQQIAC